MRAREIVRQAIFMRTTALPLLSSSNPRQTEVHEGYFYRKVRYGNIETITLLISDSLDQMTPDVIDHFDHSESIYKTPSSILPAPYNQDERVTPIHTIWQFKTITRLRLSRSHIAVLISSEGLENPQRRDRSRSVIGGNSDVLSLGNALNHVVRFFVSQGMENLNGEINEAVRPVEVGIRQRQPARENIVKYNKGLKRKLETMGEGEVFSRDDEICCICRTKFRDSIVQPSPEQKKTKLEKEDDDDSEEEDPVTRVILECGHSNVCFSCVSDQFKTCKEKSDIRPKCPTCKRSFMSLTLTQCGMCHSLPKKRLHYNPCGHDPYCRECNSTAIDVSTVGMKPFECGLCHSLVDNFWLPPRETN